jgi:putative membrane protein
VATLGAAGALAAPSAALAHGDRVAVSDLPQAWHADPAVLALAALAAALFVQAFLRLRRRGRPDRAGWGRLALFALALAVGVLPLVSPLDAAADEYLLSAHMLEHVLIGDAAVALAVVALRGPLVFFLLPPVVLRPLARLNVLRRALAALLRPRVALAAWAAAMAAWHVPVAYDYTLSHRVVHGLEHLCFVVAGVLVWIQLVDPARRRRLSIPRRLAFAAVLFALGLGLADTLLFSFRPLYPAYAAQDERLFGLSPLADQRLAGAVMMAEQAVALGLCACLLVLAYRRSASRRRSARLVQAA